jgi:hypothetical protein
MSFQSFLRFIATGCIALIDISRATISAMPAFLPWHPQALLSILNCIKLDQNGFLQLTIAKRQYLHYFICIKDHYFR